MVDNKDKDFEPFDDDDESPDIDLDERNDYDKLPTTEKSKGADKNNNSEEEDDLLLGDKPKVSENKQKNLVLMIIGGLIVLYFVYNFTLGSAPKKVVQPKNEKERMEKKTIAPVAVQGKTPIPIIDTTEQVDPNDVIPPAPPPPVIEPPTKINIGVGVPPILNPEGMGENKSGGQTPADNNPSNGSNSGEGNPIFGDDEINPTDSIPGLPPIEDDSSIGEPPGIDDGIEGGLEEPDLEDEQKRQEAMQRMQAPMMLIQGLEARPEEPEEPEEGSGNQPDDEAPYTQYTLQNTSALQSDATKTWHLNSVILQGKMIDAVLETAINTDLTGGLRAIVSRDVYAESGKRILIPKGSRLIGAFDLDNQEFKFGRARVLVVWTRVIRPDGVDAMFDEQSTDFLARAGVSGEVDNRFMDIFGSAILLSSITIAFAYAAEEITGAQSSTEIGQNGQVIDTSTPTTQAVRQAVDTLGGEIKTIADRMFEKNPRITVDQGTRIKIFVNRDIRFAQPVEEGDEPIEIIQ